jgi:cytochrome c oxidase cbb3-type subunit 3
MSNFWSWWIIGWVTLNIAGMVWLIRWTSKPHPGEAAQGDNTTGHTWDGDLQEYNNPLPRWWLWMFYITIVFAVLYLALYPGLGRVTGVLSWSKEGQWQKEMAVAKERYRPIFEKYARMDFNTLTQDPEGNKVGKRLYLTYCALCHGSDAQGARGFPNLADSDWLYGGTPEAIKASILNGRSGNMPPLGAAVGGEQGIDEVAHYVLSLSGRDHDATKAQAGKAKFVVCMGCHGPDGKGNQALGAPNLTDNVWLYGGSLGVIKQTIAQGRNGRMPAQGKFLGEDKVHVVAAYVYGLSQSELERP